MDACAEADCEEPATVRLHDPRGPDRDVCAGHARALVQSPGVVARPLEGAAEVWAPSDADGAADRG